MLVAGAATTAIAPAAGTAVPWALGFGTWFGGVWAGWAGARQGAIGGVAVAIGYVALASII